MNVVRDCMFPDVTTLSPSTTFLGALHRVMRHSSGFAVVLDAMAVVGLVTEFDFLRWVVAGHDIARTCIRDLPISIPQTVREDTPCQSLLSIYNHRRFRRFPVLNEEALLSGGITEKQILKSLPRSKLMVHYRVADVLGSAPPVVSVDMTYQEVARKMVQWHRGCVLVSEGERLLCLLTEGDLLRFRISPQWHPDALLSQLPRVEPVTIEPQCSLLMALDLFNESSHRRIPVVEPGENGQELKWVGLLTQTDLLKQVVDSARSRKAVLNPEDIHEPAIWFEPEGEHRILALNEKGAKAMALDPFVWVGRSIHDLAVDPAIWDAITVLLQSSGSINRITLPLRSGTGGGFCASCRFSLVHTPTGEDRVFWTVGGMEVDQRGCK